MGDPKLRKKTYKKPQHPWQKDRIEEERKLMQEYGLKNKKEIWKANSLLRKYTKQAKKLIGLTTPQAEAEKSQLLKKLLGLGLIKEGAKIEDVLAISLQNILDRRLQTIVYKNKLARSVRQARRFITHGHISVDNRKVTVPSFLVPIELENKISFTRGSPLFDENHPERAVIVGSTTKANKK